jgi:DNA mismatch endonuclease (patch repair protein)
MRAIRSANTLPELVVRRHLHAQGYRFRVNVSSLPGKPDIVLRKHNAIVMVHGCFWHSHSCSLAGELPRSNMQYWKPKLERTRQRDEESKKELLALGWRVLTVWECALVEGNGERREESLMSVSDWLLSKSKQGEIEYRASDTAVGSRR